MIIYNITINITDEAHDPWLAWLKREYIPRVLATGKFVHAKICKVLVDEEMGGTTYSIQFTAPDRQSLERYHAEDARRIQTDMALRFEGQLVSFATELEVLHQQDS